jgi:hypothetical protein
MATVVKVQRWMWVVVALLLLPIAHAASYSIIVTPVDAEIYRNETATYTVSISNFDPVQAQYQVYTIDPSWGVRTDPFDLTVSAKSEKTFTLIMRPLSAADYGNQGVTVYFKDLNSDTLIKKAIVVSLRDPFYTNDRGYTPTVSMDVLMPYEIDPREEIPLRVELRNRNPLNISDLTIKVTGSDFAKESTLSLPPLSEKTRDITGLRTDPRSAPGDKDITIQLLYQGTVIAQVAKNYKVKEYTEVKERVTTNAFFFKTTKDVALYNDGNVQNTAIVRVPTSLIKNLFVNSDIPYEMTTYDGQRVLVWSIPLDPEETTAFTYTENYRILILLVLLAIASGIAYFLLRSPIVGLKEAVAIAHGGGVSDIKVRLFVRNRSAKLIQGIQVTDRVPSLADVIKTESPGSIAPTKIAVSDKQGTLLRWELEVLEPFEERILTYQVKSKLKIIGRMHLPNAKIRYTVGGKERAVYSNTIELVEKFQDT